MKQLAYARRVWGAKGEDKKSIALDVGYSPAVANSVVSKIESRPGFNNAIARLAADSNNMAIAVLAEFKARGLEDFSNKDLISATNAIVNAWSKFNKGLEDSVRPRDNGGNRLRTVVLQQIQNQLNIPASEPLTHDPVDEEEFVAEDEELEF